MCRYFEKNKQTNKQTSKQQLEIEFPCHGQKNKWFECSFDCFQTIHIWGNRTIKSQLAFALYQKKEEDKTKNRKREENRKKILQKSSNTYTAIGDHLTD